MPTHNAYIAEEVGKTNTSTAKIRKKKTQMLVSDAKLALQVYTELLDNSEI